MGLLDNLNIDISCPECAQKFQVSLQKVQKGVNVTCPRCARQIRLISKGDDLGKVEKAYTDLEETIKELNKNIEYKL